MSIFTIIRICSKLFKIITINNEIGTYFLLLLYIKQRDIVTLLQFVKILNKLQW